MHEPTSVGGMGDEALEVSAAPLSNSGSTPSVLLVLITCQIRAVDDAILAVALVYCAASEALSAMPPTGVSKNELSVFG